jgi:hypothetical protein
MKTTKAIVIWFVTYMVAYLVLSLVGCLFFDEGGCHLSYCDVTGNVSWFLFYGIFLGWWLSSIVAMDYYDHR